MPLPSGFPLADEVHADLPKGTAVTEDRIDAFLLAAYARVARCHGTATVPVNDVTKDLIWHLAYARSLKFHYTKGEGHIETPTADSELAMAEDKFLAYCTETKEAKAAEEEVIDPYAGLGAGYLASIERSPF